MSAAVREKEVNGTMGADESKLDWVDRLGLAYCRLNRWEWDESLLGPKPDPHEDENYRSRVMIRIETIIGYANVSRCWWVYELGATVEDWLRWYIAQPSKNREHLLLEQIETEQKRRQPS